MKTVEYLGKLYVVEGSVGAPDGAIFLDSLPADKLVTLRNILTSALDLGRSIKMFQSKAKGIAAVASLLFKWDTAEFDDDLPEEMQPTAQYDDSEVAEASPHGPAAGDEAKVALTGAADDQSGKKREGKVRAGSKQAALIDLLKRPEGASIKEIAAILSWMTHTVRGAISRDLKKRLGLPVTKSRVEGRGQVYRIES